MGQKKVVIVGAGVSGLTTALQLSKHRDLSITIVAKHSPGDYDIEYCSPWAGADYSPFSKADTPARTYETQTWPVLAHLAENVPEAGIHFQGSVSYVKASSIPKDSSLEEVLKEDEWLKDLLPDFRLLDDTDKLPPGVVGGFYHKSVCINVPVYLGWLLGSCVKNGVVIKRGTLEHICDAAELHSSGGPADVVINCTGLGSRKLGGIEDEKMYPIRGQIVVVRNETNGVSRSAINGSDESPDEVTYAMGRAVGGGTVLGGCRQAGRWDSAPDEALAKRIMQRCVELCPDLVGEGQGIEGLSVVRHSVGLRPQREGDIRIEREVVRGCKGGHGHGHGQEDAGVVVVHNYGHGGYGYQSSYGCAYAVEKLVLEAVGDRPRL